jgi:branched-chain amino acid transport system substrate-binding protein
MSYSPDGEVIIKQAKELGVTLPIYAAEPIENVTLAKNLGPLANGVIYIRPYINSTLGKKFSEAYEAKYGHSAEINDARSYDALRSLTEAARKCNLPLGAECVKSELFKIQNFEGTIGSISFDASGDVYLPYTPKTIKDGQFIKLEE